MGPPLKTLQCWKVNFQFGSPKGTTKCDLHFVEKSEIRGTRLYPYYLHQVEHTGQFGEKVFEISYLGPWAKVVAHEQQCDTLLTLSRTLFQDLQIVENFFLYKVPHFYLLKKSLFLFAIFGSNEKKSRFDTEEKIDITYYKEILVWSALMKDFSKDTSQS